MGQWDNRIKVDQDVTADTIKGLYEMNFAQEYKQRFFLQWRLGNKWEVRRSKR